MVVLPIPLLIFSITLLHQYGGGRNISLGGETLTAEEKAAKDKRTRELLAAYMGGRNKTMDAKTKAECTEVHD